MVFASSFFRSILLTWLFRFLEKLVENFEDPLVKILCVALGITLTLAFFGYADWIEGIGIAVAVFLATFVATYSEFKNEASFQELQEKASRSQNNVFRNGSDLIKLQVVDIVVGDMVLLQAGDKIPADGTVFAGEIQVNQASLSGEREEVKKRKAPSDYVMVNEPTEEDMAGPFYCFRGTVVDDGEAVMRVHKVGESTYYGKMQKDLFEKDERLSPLQVKLTALADGISMLGYVGATFIAFSFLFKQFVMDNHYSWTKMVEYFGHWEVALHDVVTAVILGIIIIVVAVPEGLPMMIAIVLSLNMRKLLQGQVLVRKLLGIETAGSLNLLFADKTGTITRGFFTPSLFIAGDLKSFETFSTVPVALRNLYALAVREASSAVVSPSGIVVGGNSSDRALLTFLDNTLSNEKFHSSIIKEILFNSERKFSAARLRVRTDATADILGINVKDFRKAEFREVSVVKGAPEILFERCSSFYASDGTRQRLSGTNPLLRELDGHSEKGLRFIAIAISDEDLSEDQSLPGELCLVGIVGLLDEIRPEAKSALDMARSAGIKVVMMTGDRKETAEHVAHSVGLLGNKGARSAGQGVITSAQLALLSDDQVKERLLSLAVIARARPTDKSRLVRLAQEMDMVVGMTGDGVNDSIALKHADVGFAMGSGAEVAKEASDIVILDDNIASILSSCKYGRTIYKSIQKFITFQSTVNLASGILTLVGPFLHLDFALTLVQLLWVNLVMDTLAALAFGGEPALARTMTERPIARHAPIITPLMWSAIIWNGLAVAGLCLGFLTYDPIQKVLFSRVVPGHRDDIVFLTAFFGFFIFCTVFAGSSLRAPDTLNIFDHLAQNRGYILVMFVIFGVQIVFSWLFGAILRTVGLTAAEWATVTLMASVMIPLDAVRKSIVFKLLPSSVQATPSNMEIKEA
jgi:calcium-translocating P-type ATPase